MIAPHQLMAICGSLLLSAFFSGIEIAFLSADKLSLALEKERNTFSGRLMATLLQRPDRFITTTLIGNTIALVLYSNAMVALLDPLLQAYLPAPINNSASILLVQTILSTLGILIIAEFIPKSIFLLSPNRLLTLFALPTLLLAFLLRPLVVITTSISRIFITYLLGIPYQEQKPVFGLTDLQAFIRNTLNANSTVPASMSARMVSKLIQFKDAKVRDCMVPRTDIVAVGIQDSIETFQQTATKSDHPKILVYQNDIDDIIGYCHTKELFKKPKNIESMLTPIIIVSETNLASEAMLSLAKEGKSLALVVDEFGGTSGIVSIEDIMEEIVGKIQNEHDTTALIEQKIGANTYLLSARHEVSYLQEKYGWELPEGDYDTLGGLIISVTESIPLLNETIKVPPFTFTIISLENTHIDTVKLTVEQRPVHEL